MTGPKDSGSVLSLITTMSTRSVTVQGHGGEWPSHRTLAPAPDYQSQYAAQSALSHAKLVSSLRCRLRSVPSVQPEATHSAAGSVSTNGIPCLLDSVAWQPPWKTVPVKMTGLPATVLHGCLRETTWSPTGMNAQFLSSTPSI